MTPNPALALQDAVYKAIGSLAGGAVYYDVPADAALPWIYFGDDDLSPALDAGPMTDATVNIEIYATDKLTLKALVVAVTDRLDTKLAIEGFDVVEWQIGSTNFRLIDTTTFQASLEFDYLIQAAD